jgi:hypothetical protein
MSKKDDLQRQRLAEWRKIITKIIDDDRNYRRLLIRTECNLIDQVTANSLLAPSGPMIDACIYFGLDLQNSSHRILLLGVLASVVFGHRRKGRRKNSKQWHAARLYVLGGHYEAVALTWLRL